MGPTPMGSPTCFLEKSEHDLNLLCRSRSLGMAFSFLIHRKPVSIKGQSITYATAGIRGIGAALPADEWDRV